MHHSRHIAYDTSSACFSRSSVVNGAIWLAMLLWLFLTEFKEVLRGNSCDLCPVIFALFYLCNDVNHVCNSDSHVFSFQKRYHLGTNITLDFVAAWKEKRNIFGIVNIQYNIAHVLVVSRMRMRQMYFWSVYRIFTLVWSLELSGPR